MESQPQNPEFRNNPENFHPCICYKHQNLTTWLLYSIRASDIIGIDINPCPGLQLNIQYPLLVSSQSRPMILLITHDIHSLNETQCSSPIS